MPLSTFLGLETTLRGHPRPAAGARRHRPQHREREHVGYTRQTAVTGADRRLRRPRRDARRRPAARHRRRRAAPTSGCATASSTSSTARRRCGRARPRPAGRPRQIEVAFNEPSDTGLNSLLEVLGRRGRTSRTRPRTWRRARRWRRRAASLANGFKRSRTQLPTVQTQTGQHVTDTISQVNAIGAQIAQLNDGDPPASVTGDTAERPARPARRADRPALGARQRHRHRGTLGTVDITIGGATLVTGDAPPADARRDRHDEPHLGQARRPDPAFATRRSRGYQTQLDTARVDADHARRTPQHAAGFDLNGNAGGAFFTRHRARRRSRSTPRSSRRPALIAASGNGQPGNADNALAMADMQQTRRCSAARRSTPPTRSS